jgi:3'(2'), 5'-bisphosphate nucleotidase
MDSQCKYSVVARGEANIYLRLPVSETYEEKIWDHAAGSLIVEESGGVVTDIDGKPLDFSLGRTLRANKGIVATSQSLHPQVIDAIRKVKANI